jgi:LAGLIDADG endonuclease
LNITNNKNINHFIDLFNLIPFYGAKALDYSDFCKIITIINNKEHLTKEGMLKAVKLVKGMNSQRTNFDS